MNDLEKHIRCKYRKRRKCKRCKTEVIARGELNANNKQRNS